MLRKTAISYSLSIEQETARWVGWLQRGKANGTVRTKAIPASPRRWGASVLHFCSFRPSIIAGL